MAFEIYLPEESVNVIFYNAAALAIEIFQKTLRRQTTADQNERVGIHDGGPSQHRVRIADCLKQKKLKNVYFSHSRIQGKVLGFKPLQIAKKESCGTEKLSGTQVNKSPISGHYDTSKTQIFGTSSSTPGVDRDMRPLSFL